MDVLIEGLPTSELDHLLRALKEGRLAKLVQDRYPGPPGLDAETATFDFAYGLLKLLSDDRRSRAIWAALTETGETAWERPRVVLDLWRLFDCDEGHRYLRDRHRGLAYHRRHFFDWFRDGYELGRARSILAARGGAAVRNVHFPLLVAMLLLAGAHSAWPPLASPVGGGWRPWTLLAVGAAYTLAMAAQVACFHTRPLALAERWLRAGQSLVPRLAAASVVGLVILASSEELLSFVVGGASWWRAGILLSASFVYLLLEMSHRIQPLPSPRRLLRLGLDVSATALAHGLAIALSAERALRSILVPVRNPPLDLLQLVNVAAFLLAIGLIVNLIWAREPVTQPL